MNIAIQIGDKFYKSNGDEYSVIRVVRMKNTETCVIKDEENKLYSIKKKTLMDDYKRIKPDGYITFTVVKVGDGKDVIVSLNRTREIEKGVDIPYAVCRQNIYDVFTNNLLKEGPQSTTEAKYVGVSVSVETIPADVPFQITLACDGVDYARMVSVYLDDKLEDILRFVKPDRFDTALRYLKENSVNSGFVGYCDSLKDLLFNNQFMIDFYSAFNILQVPCTIIYDDSVNGVDVQMNIEQAMWVSDIMRKTMVNPILIKYSKEIRVDLIQRDYTLISDSLGDIYIMVYDVKTSEMSYKPQTVQ